MKKPLYFSELRMFASHPALLQNLFFSWGIMVKFEVAEVSSVTSLLHEITKYTASFSYPTATFFAKHFNILSLPLICRCPQCSIIPFLITFIFLWYCYNYSYLMNIKICCYWDICAYLIVSLYYNS